MPEDKAFFAFHNTGDTTLYAPMALSRVECFKATLSGNPLLLMACLKKAVAASSSRRSDKRPLRNGKQIDLGGWMKRISK
jgi:hypothetical protein